ncbi:hypothetical protein N0V82_006144 [Gnomoniopsis sp. IMI 355080]|nr:hypothetical protein N0V82_006144 [Gnomoniopsis sp. IMI 355080]
MPPKRGRGGGGARGGARAASRTPGPRESTPFSPALRSQQTPGPPRFSTSYGSPAVLTGSRGYRSGGAANAISNALDSVQAADRQDRALRNAEEEEESVDSLDESRGDADAGAPSESAAPVSRQAPTNASRRGQQRAAAYESDSQDTDEEDAATSMPPPPLPFQRGMNGNSRVAAPQSDTRSFTEETRLFTGAGLGTPRPGSRSSRQETPSRSSARIAARSDVAKVQAGPRAHQIEEEDEEDELATAPAQPPRASRSSLPRGNTPKTLDRVEQVSQSRERSRDIVSDQEEEAPRPQSQRNGNTQQIRNPSGDATSANANLPIPKTLDVGQPSGQAGPSNLPAVRPARELGFAPNLAPRSPRAGGRFDNSASGSRPNDPTLGESPEDQPLGGRAGSPRAPDNDKDPHDDDDDEPEGLFSIFNDGLERTLRFKKWPRWLKTGLQMWGLLTFFSILFLILLQVFVPPNRWEGVKVSRNYTYTPLGNWRQKIAQFVPWVVLHPFAVLTGNLDYVDFRTALHWAEWNHQQNTIRLDYLWGATFQVRRILPELIAVNVDKSSNEWDVGDSFWAALDEEMKHGGLHHSLLTMERSADGSYVISDEHWYAIVSRMQNDGMLISGQPGAGDDDVTSDQITAVVERTVSQRWDEWLRKNNDALKRVLGADKEEMSAHYAEVFGDFEQRLLERVQNYEERLVSREEFIEKIQHISNAYGVQIKAEMEAMQDRLRHAIEIAENWKQTASLPDGVSREQVGDMIDGAIKRAVADAQLESIAKGNMKGHLENELSGHKNYFSGARGAGIDHTLTSASYSWSTKGIMGENEPRSSGLLSLLSRGPNSAFRDGGEKAGGNYSPGKALEKWDEDGECWCAGHADSNNSSRIADISILTADTVIPQHLVVEHITASGSFDPDAMPKDLEVWIRTPSDRRRRTLLEWSGNIWSDAKFGNGARLMAKGFAKIGEFKYLNTVGKGEKQVFRLSEDLLDLDAQTQQVVVRSKSNYGAQDHTCFYRLQLFGKEGKELDRGEVD